MLAIHPPAIKFCLFIKDQDIKCVFWINMKHTPGRNLLLAHGAATAGSCHFANLFHSYFLHFWQHLTEICFALSFPALLDPNEKVSSYIEKFRAKAQASAHLAVMGNIETAPTTLLLSFPFSRRQGDSQGTEAQRLAKMTLFSLKKLRTL